MLSIQSPGYVGMERFGVDISLDSIPNQRTSRECELQTDSTKSHDLLRSSDSSLLSRKMVINKNSLMKEKIDHNQHYCHHAHDGSIHCPHHVPLPDCEWNSAGNHNSNNLRIRNAYQQAEITRSYIKPPPNKTVLDVPITSFNIIPEASSMHLNNERHHGTIQTSVKQFKFNPITKFLLRISSPKTHENHSGNENISYSSNSNSNNNNNHHHHPHPHPHQHHPSNNSSCSDVSTATAPATIIVSPATTATTTTTTTTTTSSLSSVASAAGNPLNKSQTSNPVRHSTRNQQKISSSSVDHLQSVSDFKAQSSGKQLQPPQHQQSAKINKSRSLSNNINYCSNSNSSSNSSNSSVGMSSSSTPSANNVNINNCNSNNNSNKNVNIDTSISTPTIYSSSTVSLAISDEKSSDSDYTINEFDSDLMSTINRSININNFEPEASPSPSQPNI